MPSIVCFFWVALTVLGDARNVITPLGYWAFWCVWLLIAFAAIIYRSPNRPTIKQYINSTTGLCIGFVSLAAAAMLTGIVNSDFESFYQAVKFLAILFLGLLIFLHGKSLNSVQIYQTAAFGIIVAATVFLISKLYGHGWHIELGDGRQGSIIVYPGVLWKAGAFFSSFALAKMLDEREIQIGPLLIYLAGVYLVTVDGSRTGFLLLLIAALTFISARVFESKKFLIKIVIIAVITLVSTGIAYMIFTNMSYETDLWLGVSRLAAGDQTRQQMLIDGIQQSAHCFPSGCGFGSTTSDTTDGPMVVHNAFVGAAGDLGILGFLGLLIILFSQAIRILRMVFVRSTTGNYKIYALRYQNLAIAVGIFGYILTMLLHPLSSELSEWGYLLLISAWIPAARVSHMHRQPIY